MLEIRGHNIYIIRGDTGGIEVKLKDGRHDLHGYTAVLSVKKMYEDNEYAIQKTSNTGRFFFFSEDTNDLEPGIYQYDIQITIPGENGSVDQIATINKGSFVILADVTR